MRIRQVRPEFFNDPVTGHLSPAVALVYIGLWCVADDAGWLRWDAAQIGAILRPYQSVPVRERLILQAVEELAGVGRLMVYDCGCIAIPTLPDHQKIGGNKTTSVLSEHRSFHAQSGRVHTGMGEYLRNGKVSNGTLLAREDGQDEKTTDREGLKGRLGSFEEVIRGGRHDG